MIECARVRGRDLITYQYLSANENIDSERERESGEQSYSYSLWFVS